MSVELHIKRQANQSKRTPPHHRFTTGNSMDTCTNAKDNRLSLSIEHTCKHVASVHTYKFKTKSFPPNVCSRE